MQRRNQCIEKRASDRGKQTSRKKSSQRLVFTKSGRGPTFIAYNRGSCLGLHPFQFGMGVVQYRETLESAVRSRISTLTYQCIFANDADARRAL
jgi:hypothetical protein